MVTFTTSPFLAMRSAGVYMLLTLKSCPNDKGIMTEQIGKKSLVTLVHGN